jgi:membrane-associated phospholipid phosphatase
VKFASVYLQTVISVVKSNRIFYLTFTVFLLLALYHQLTSSQFALSIWVNNWHTPFLDATMIWLTNAGDGIFLTAAGAVLILVKRKWWLVVITCLTVPSIITQLLKHTIFSEVHRPSVLMQQIPDLYYVKGVVMNQFNSFPSGHSTAAFSLYTLLALMIPHKQSGWIWAVLAATIALSRVYLLQHFWADIMAGSFIGLTTCTLLYAWLQPKNAFDEIKR